MIHCRKSPLNARSKVYPPTPQSVYPRVCGGTPVLCTRREPGHGLYPACAGEPAACRASPWPPAVYPRVREGLTVENNERVPVPEGVKAQLKQEAEQTGEVATTTTTMRYDHDLDSGETDARPTGGSSIAAKVAAIQARNGSAAGSLSPQGRKAMDQIASARAQAARGKARRRSSSRHDKLNDSPAQLPELVVMQEAL